MLTFHKKCANLCTPATVRLWPELVLGVFWGYQHIQNKKVSYDK